jgi:hypothetical protein
MSTLNVEAISHPTSGSLVTINGTAPSNRNLIINGAMQVAQRGTSSTASGYGTVDRFRAGYGGGDQTQSQVAITSGDPFDEGFRYIMRVTNTATATAAGNNRNITYKIEAQDIALSGWNYTSATSYITLSFWVRASVEQTYYVRLQTSDGTGQNYGSAFALSEGTWTKVTKTIPGNSNITINSDNGTGLQVIFVPFDGTDFTDSGFTTDAWGTYSSSNRLPDMTNTWAGTTDATFDITGVQLEVGEVATPFEHRSYGDELRRCQRYYQSMNVANMKFTTARWDQSSGVGECNVYLRETMRAAPSFAFTGTWDTGGGWGGDPVMTLAREDFVVLTTTVSTVAASGVKVLRTDTAGATISFAAEL